MGNLDDAILLYSEILKKNPGYLPAQKNLDTALSLTPNLSEGPTEPLIENISYPKLVLSEKNEIKNSEKQNPDDFFSEVSIAFSTLSSLFDFLN